MTLNRRWVIILLAVIGAPACGDDKNGPPQGDAATTDVAFAGGADLNVFPTADTRTAAIEAGSDQPFVHPVDAAVDANFDLGLDHAGPVQVQLVNATAYLPPQCYTQTRPSSGASVNTCYTCHRAGTKPNFVDDSQFQLAYALPAPARRNPWTNLFVDRRARAEAVSDDSIRSYVRTDNFSALARTLSKPAAAWDHDGDGAWGGYVPDCAFTFDDRGFDRTSAGVYTGWRAFAYYPFPGTYWPSNGSADDVLIRLAEPLRTNAAGQSDLAVYAINLAIVEALISRRNVAIDPTDEKVLGVDLDKDGTLGTTTLVAYDWAPLQNRTMSFVGQAKAAQERGELHLAAGLFPEGTEFIQTLRYLDVAADGSVTMAARMKELRYARKVLWRNYAELEAIALDEIKDRHDFPDDTRLFSGDVERGIRQPDSGWLLQGFIEDASGALRPQTFEETAYCMGCHGGGLGATTDSMFAFARKVGSDSHRRGWYHWSQKGLAGLNEPKVEIAGAGVYYEYAYFLMYTKSGSEFLANPELHDAFFRADDTPRLDQFADLHDDISLALLPSATRAMALNKTYKMIVEDQSFVAGRDVLLAPATRVLREVADGESTGIGQATALGPLSGCYGPTCEADRTSPVLTAFEQTVLGVGMDGPDGQDYEVDWQGLIHKSRYANGLAGVSFTFPRRLTLPTREIVALRDTPSCYTCHRMHAPIVDGQRKTMLEPGVPPDVGAPTESSTSTRLTSDPGHDTGARFSPDGKTIAFVSDRTGTDQVWLMNADGTNQRALTQGPAKHAWPEWHPDGSRLVVWGHNSGQQSIAVVAVDGTTGPTLVTSSEALDRPVYRPDGLTIAYGATTASNWDVWVIGADGTQQVRLTTDPAMESNPLWSPDGKALAYKVAPSGRYGLTIENFMTFEKGLANPTVHTWNGPQAIQMNAWSPDGRQVAYTAEVISSASGTDRVSYANVVSTLDLTGADAVATTSFVISKGQTLGDRGAVFSPDGKRVAFWAWNKRFRATLWITDLTSRQVQQVTTLGLDMAPQWSPDGTKLVFESNRGGNTDLWSVKAP